MNATLDFADTLDELHGLSNRLGDKEALAKAVGQTFLDLIRAGFDTGTSPQGNQWLPLKIRKGGKPLLDTGDLRDSITATVTEGGEAIDLLADRIQARIQQLGGTIYPVNGPFLVFPGADGHPIFARKVILPARPYLPDGDDFLRTWVSAIDATMTGYVGMEPA